jgi:hypothetical protein
MVTGYPYGEYTEAREYSLDNAVMIDESAGRGFNDTKIAFYPDIEGQRVKVEIDFKFRSLPHDLTCYVFCEYDRNGNAKHNTIRKSASSLGGNLAAKSYAFGGGSSDSMHNYHIIDLNKLIEGLKND